jgi:hypothetical protein
LFCPFCREGDDVSAVLESSYGFLDKYDDDDEEDEDDQEEREGNSGEWVPNAGVSCRGVGQCTCL